MTYTLCMAKCPDGCTCKRHRKVGKACPAGCSCARHKVTDQRRKRISAARSGKALTPAHREALKCEPGCACGKHALRNAGQFKPGSAGFSGTHTEETRTKLASYTGANASNYKHGWSGTPTYVSWSAMWGRCTDPRNASYPSYGGRGITVCERWGDFLNFLADMGRRPSLNHSLDRRNADGHYEPGNVRWATRAQQNAGRRDPGGWMKRRQRQK